MQPSRTVSVWLAIFDTDEQNAAMRIVKGSHSHVFEHNLIEKEHFVLDQEVDQVAIKSEDIVSMDLKAGEISLHDNQLLHGSGPNHSDRIRAVQIMRFCPTEVKCDLNVWPKFESYLVRGVDEFKHNPVGKEPKGYNYPIKVGQGSWEFE